MKTIAISILALMSILAVLALVGCGTAYQVNYIDPTTGISAGYSSKRGIDINFQPFKPRSEK